MCQIKKIALIQMFLIFSICVAAQEKESYIEIDKKTYSLYLQRNWKELIKAGKISLKKGITFYYLQVRMGIAYYELKKYRKAVPYFEKARKINAKNELVNEYLYYSYIFSGRSFDAKKISGEFSESLKINLGISKNAIISSISVISRIESFEDYTIYPDDDELSLQNVRDGYSYYSIGFEHFIKNKQKIAWSYNRTKTNSTVYNIELDNQVQENRKIIQNQFYFSYHNQLAKGLNLILATHLINIVSDGSTLSPSGGWDEGIEGDSLGSDGTVGPGPGHGPGPGFKSSAYITGGTDSMLTTTHFMSNELIGYFALRKDFSNFKIGVNTSLSNIDKYFQIQPGIDLSYYPLANTNIYFLTKANYKFENRNNIWQNELVIKQTIGFRLLTIYIEPSYTYGNIINFTENDAFIIHNDNDIIKNRIELLAYGYFFKNKLNLFIQYQNYIKSSIYILNSIFKETNFQNQTLTGGIKWNF